MTFSLRFRRLILCHTGALLGLVMLSSEAGLTQVNAVYVESNVGQVSNMNSVYAFANDGTGKLTQLTGSPYLTGGTGVFSSTPNLTPGFMADQEIVVNAAGTLMFTVNGHSNTITTFNVNADGSLTLASSAGSNGQDPVSIGLAENSAAGTQMTIVNQAADPSQTGGTPNITTFLVDSAGALTPVAGSTITYPASSNPSQVVVNPPAKFVFAVQEMAGGALSSYTIQTVGTLILNNTLTPRKGSEFLGAAAHPKLRAIYVGLPGVNMICAYTYNTSGTLAFSHLVADQGKGVGWLTVNKAATRLYTSEPGSNSVTVWNISGPKFNFPVKLQHLTLMSGGVGTNLKLDPTGAFLYVLGLNNPPTGSGNFLHVLNVSSTNGALTETLAPVAIPVASGEIPQGLAVVMK